MTRNTEPAAIDLASVGNERSERDFVHFILTENSLTNKRNVVTYLGRVGLCPQIPLFHFEYVNHRSLFPKGEKFGKGIESFRGGLRKS